MGREHARARLEGPDGLLPAHPVPAARDLQVAAQRTRSLVARAVRLRRDRVPDDQRPAQLREVHAREEFGAEDGRRRASWRRWAERVTVTIRAYPIGIEAEASSRGCPPAPAAEDAIERMHAVPVAAADLILGVDRMDYSKGIPERFEAMGQACWTTTPSFTTRSPTRRSRRPAGPSRGGVRRPARGRSTRLSGRINGDYGDLDWIPIRYLARQLPERGAGRTLPHRADRAGHAAARRHEPRRQGVRGRPGPRRTPASWCSASSRAAAEQLSGGAAAGEPARRVGHGGRDEARRCPCRSQERKRRWARR